MFEYVAQRRVSRQLATTHMMLNNPEDQTGTEIGEPFDSSRLG